MNYEGLKGILIGSIASVLVLSFSYIEICLILKINKYIKINGYGFKNK